MLLNLGGNLILDLERSDIMARKRRVCKTHKTRKHDSKKRKSTKKHHKSGKKHELKITVHHKY